MVIQPQEAFLNIYLLKYRLITVDMKYAAMDSQNAEG